MADGSYSIMCQGYKGDFAKLKKLFDYSIRPICCPVTLTDSNPLAYTQTIEPIATDNVVSDFEGMCITKPQIDNIITSKFHDIEFIDISSVPGRDALLIITVSDDTPDESIYELKGFLQKIELSFKDIVVRKQSEYCSRYESSEGKWDKLLSSYSEDPVYCFTDKSFPFSINDADYWFANAEKIYKGDISRYDLPFFYPRETKCYMDATGFSNVNLRNNILLYDKTFISLPLKDNFDKFLAKQNIRKNELIELAQMGKIVIFLPNTESRYDRNFLLDIYKHNEQSIISKRGINALLGCYMTEIEFSYLSDYPVYKNMAKELHDCFKDSDDERARQISKFISWPYRLKAESFEILNHHGPMSVGGFGANKAIEDLIHAAEKTNEISFEFTVNSSNIHIASALQSTYFPFREEAKGEVYSDIGVSTILANLLNSYLYSSSKDIEQIKRVSDIKNKENNYINLLHCDNSVSIIKFAQKSLENQTTVTLKNILSRLEEMDETKRRDKIREYNNLLCDISEIPDKERFKCLKYFLGAASIIPVLPLPISIAVTLAELGVKSLDKALSLGKKGEKRQIKYKIDKAGRNGFDELVDDVYILDKISRIAKVSGK